MGPQLQDLQVCSLVSTESGCKALSKGMVSQYLQIARHAPLLAHGGFSEALAEA